MTTLKTGDRVVPGRFESSNHLNPYFKTDMEPLVGVPGEITKINCYGHCEVHGWFWPEHALTLVNPKWEPDTLIHGQWYDVNDLLPPKDGLYICWCKSSTGEKGLVRYHTELGWQYGYKDDVTHWMIVDPPIPISPSPEEELTNYLFDKGHRISKPLISDILDYFNRHKEGEGK